ncbi:nuclear envelope phosphatase-regulatory subunit 1 homolog isoform X1 [Anopheles bellator]|uniref:nuclear envelope phosphatase-regulatory subunit 1 homolog isoform X1 n=1 Tax=Anopheles bellator TaxID=139047 RepID=UPI002649DD45|nr:nuclear envelope phosphatase-regulatory subunit 1 homolog isoform X1 [Anopheles bellator]
MSPSETSACEDLKAFERRLTEVIACLQPPTLRWRLLLGVTSLVTFVGAFYWLTDPRTSIVPLIESLLNHSVFTISTVILLLLFVFGIHKLVIAPQIITLRTRNVLAEFNMSCDETGKLIVRPRPTNNSRYMDLS